MFDLLFGVQESKKTSNPKSKEKPAQNEKMAIEVN